MIALSWYMLKVIICSGILCGYYFLALRNKAFHRWNRFYILAAIVISLLAPIIKINFFQTDTDKGTVVQMLQTISYGDEAVIEYSRSNGFQLTTQNVAEGSYLLISTVFLFIFFISLYKIAKLKKKYPETKIEDISFINTNAKGTPFSFFKSVYWNNAIDLHSRSGQQIFNHEIAHIKEKHSYDKIFINIVLMFFWSNPFFWLMRKELYMIHEFIADKEALEDSDISAFAEMILQTVYPGQNFSFTNNFFYSPIKRRIIMLTKNKNPKVNYISRLLVLPLAAIVFFAFTLKVKNKTSNLYDGKTITVVIDAGHGGADNGAVSTDGVKEKDITLAIAKKIAELNSNDHIKILLSRENDQYISVKDRVVFAENNSANLFISLHANLSADKQLKGFSVLIDKNSTGQDQLLGSALINELKKSYKTDDNIEIRKRGLWILNHNIYPAAIVECGFLSNPKDEAFINSSANQEKVAENILDAIEKYASSINAFKGKSPIVTDSIPTGKQDSIAKRKKTTQLNLISINGMPEKNKKEDTKVVVLKEDGSVPSPLIMVIKEHDSIPANALLIANGKEISKDEMKKIPSSNIESINVLKGKIAIKKYGDKGKDGVIEITTKSGNIFAAKKDGSNFNEIPGNTLIFVDGKEIARDETNEINPANIQSISILKGESAIKKYGNKAKEGVIEITTKNKNGNLSIVTPDAKTINGNSSPEQNDSIPDKVFTKVEIEAAFPGGPTAWQRFIVRKIQASLDSFTEADYGTCVLKFIVNTDGSVTNVEAITMEGTHLANISIEAIKNGPKWIPASQNGHTVASYRLQPVTLTNPDQKKSSAKSGQPVNFSPLTIVAVNKNILLKLLQPASFPGGQTAWLKYITRIIQKNSNDLIGNKNNLGTCKVSFNVSKDGKVSNVNATTMEGTQLAEIAINAIKKSSYWIPAKQDGQSVNSYVIQPVTFALNDQITIKGDSE